MDFKISNRGKVICCIFLNVSVSLLNDNTSSCKFVKLKIDNDTGIRLIVNLIKVLENFVNEKVNNPFLPIALLYVASFWNYLMFLTYSSFHNLCTNSFTSAHIGELYILYYIFYIFFRQHFPKTLFCCL